MERRYNIVDIEDIHSAKELMRKRRKETAGADDQKSNRTTPIGGTQDS